MNQIDMWLSIGVFILGVISLGGFFWTKKPGFGKFTTSSLLLILVVVLSALLFVAGKLETQLLANILFAIIGFAGGLFTGKDDQTAVGPSK